jgi:hypothetical protein
MTHGKGQLVSLLALLALGSPALSQSGKPKATPPPPPSALEVARVGFAEGGVEFKRGNGGWVKATEEQPLLMGDRLRTLKGGTARLEFPWTAVAVGDGTEVALQNNRVLTLQLDRGRIDIDPEQALMRVVTDEATVSGTGRTLVRREGKTTFVGSYNGGADVESKDKVVRLGINRGTVVNAGKAPAAPDALRPAPHVVTPGADPVFVKPGEPVRLVWKGPESAYHLEVLSIDSDVPVVSLDVEGHEFDLRISWIGTFRWRVAGRTGAIESQASGEGLICVVEK